MGLGQVVQDVNAETILDYASGLPGVTQGFPFDESTLVFKVGTDDKRKMFALLNVEDFKFVNLKCDPERSVELRGEFEGIKPAWHMNKTHWNSVLPDPIADVPAKVFWELLLHSYELVRDSLPVKVKSNL